MDNDSAGLFVGIILAVVAVVLWVGLISSIWSDYHPTPEKIAATKLLDKCLTKCSPNSGMIYKTKCYCSNNYKEAK